MAAILPPETPTAWELADRTSIQAFRAGRYLLIVAEGYLPTPGYDLDATPAIAAGEAAPGEIPALSEGTALTADTSGAGTSSS